MARCEEVKALFILSEKSGLTPVCDEVTILLVPLRSGAGAGCIINEKSSAEEVSSAEFKMWAMLSSIIEDSADEVSILDIVGAGRGSLSMIKSQNYPSRRSLSHFKLNAECQSLRMEALKRREVPEYSVGSLRAIFVSAQVVPGEPRVKYWVLGTYRIMSDLDLNMVL